jgi:hypothetical protein
LAQDKFSVCKAAERVDAVASSSEANAVRWKFRPAKHRDNLGGSLEVNFQILINVRARSAHGGIRLNKNVYSTLDLSARPQRADGNKND